jgi:hypothetical protein
MSVNATIHRFMFFFFFFLVKTRNNDMLKHGFLPLRFLFKYLDSHQRDASKQAGEQQPPPPGTWFARQVGAQNFFRARFA